MMRRHAVSIALAAVAVILAAYLLFVDSARITTGEREFRKRNLLPAYRRGDLSELVIESGDERIRIVRRSDDAGSTLFYLVGPSVSGTRPGDGAEIADQTAVDKVLSTLEFATPERRLDPNQDRHMLGLDAPRLRVTLAMGTITYRIAIGADAPSPPGAVYASAEGEGIDGEQLAVLPRDLWTELSRPRDVYRGRTLVPYLSSNCSAITVESGGETRQLSRGAWGGWAVAFAGRNVRVDRDTLDRMLMAFADLRAEAFASEGEAQKALSQADDKLRLTLVPTDRAAPRAVLEIGGTCAAHDEDAVAMRVEPPPKVAACIPKGLVAALSPRAAALADLHLFSLRADEIEQIELTAGDRRLELVRSGTAWHMRAPADGPVESDVGQAFAKSVRELACDKIVVTDAAAEPVAGRAAMTRVGDADDVSVDAGRSAAREEVEIGPEQSGSVYVRRAVDGAVLRCPAGVARQLSPSGTSLRSRKVVETTASQVHKIAITGGDVREVLVRSSSGGWTLDEPKSFAVDPGLAADIAEALTELHAERWVDEESDGRYGLGTPRATYELVMEAGTVRIDVGRKTERGSFAHRADVPGVFILPLSVEEKLETWAIDRSYFMVDPDDVRQIRLERGAATLTLGSARAEDAEEASRAAERFEVAKRALAEAHAEGVVHVGRARAEEGFDKPRLAITVTKAGQTTPLRWVVGGGDVFHDTNVFYVRRDGIDATFAMAQGKLRPLLEMEGLTERPRQLR